MADGTSQDGAPAPAELTGPLARMWRAVYRKAAEVAEARTVELLKYHVYVYRHGGEAGPPGPAGAGGWALLYEHEVTAAGGELALRLPATGSLPQTHGTLVLEARVRSTYTGASRSYCTLTLNDGVPVTYASALTRNDVGTLTGFASSTDNNWDVGSCPKATAPAGTYGLLTVQLPLYARTDHKKHYLAHSVASTNTADGNAYLLQAGGWVYGDPAALAAITSVQLRCAQGNLAQGTLVRLWGVTGGGTA